MKNESTKWRNCLSDSSSSPIRRSKSVKTSATMATEALTGKKHKTVENRELINKSRGSLKVVKRDRCEVFNI